MRVEDRYQTESGIPIKEVYGPEDMKELDYAREPGDLGKYPFTRGIHEHTYRGKVRQEYVMTGFGTAKATNERLKYLKDELGVTMLLVITDMPTFYHIDSDHPMAEKEAGVVGVPLCSLADMKELCEGIPLGDINFSFIAPNVPTLAQYIVAAEKRGIDPTLLRGSFGGYPPALEYTAYRNVLRNDTKGLGLRTKAYIDSIEYSVRRGLRIIPLNGSGHAIRQSGLNAVAEAAIVLQTLREVSDALIERGLSIDDFAPRFTSVMGVGMDFFEEIAEFRAVRRIWAKLAKQRNAQRPETGALKLVMHSEGSTFTFRQPLNNVVRATLQVLSAVFGGAQSICPATFDEPMCTPTKFASRLAMNTLRIIEHETGVMDVGDPLGGSYYIEHLTDKMEEEITRLMAEIEAMGGIARAGEKGWIEQMRENEIQRRQEAIRKKEKIVVGLNAFTVPAGKEERIEIHPNPLNLTEEQLKKVKELKQQRRDHEVREALQKLRSDAQDNSRNWMPSIVEAVRAYATIGEIWGTIREANGLSYDPWAP